MVCAVSYSDRAELGKRTELRTASRSTLKPDDEGDSLVGDCDAVCLRTEKAVIHSGLPLGVVPVNFFIACIRGEVPE